MYTELNGRIWENEENYLKFKENTRIILKSSLALENYADHNSDEQIYEDTAFIMLKEYRKNKKEPFICVGLWKYSRHPNYLGEILMWWGVALSVWCADTSAFYLLSGALANTVLFFSVSIPLADKRQSRKDGFEEYKRRTRMLLPIKKKLR